MRAAARAIIATAVSGFVLMGGAVDPAAAQAPTPESVFGFRPGADYELADYTQIREYFRQLDEASDRVRVERIGETTLGRPMLLALISSADNLRNRERYKEIARRLALTKDLTDAEARRLSKEGKAIVWIDAGLHSTEVAAAQHAPEFAHWLATDEGDEASQIREEAIVLLMPVMNPDGHEIVVDWYERNVGTPYETADLPELYHHYIGHDNNRDWYMFTQVESQAVADVLYHEWFPQIVYNHHQTGPFPGRIWGPPFENPVNPNLPPLVVSSINQIGEHMRKRFDEEGKPGYSSGIVYDMWWNGSMRGAPDYHNMLGFLTETSLHEYATPRCYGEDEIPDDFGDRADNLPAKRPTTDYTRPWLGGCWHLRDAVDYMLTASRAVADIGAELKDDYLYNIYRIGKRQIARAERADGGPFAYVVDVEAQHDPGAAVEFLRTLRQGGIEIRRAERSFRAGGESYPAGSYVIPPQAFRPYVVDLLEPKTYPDRRLYPGGPPEPPYDMTGYDLNQNMGVETARIGEPFEMPGPAVDRIPAPSGAVRGSAGYGYLLSPEQNKSALAVNRLLADGAELARTAEDFEAAGERWPAGTLVVRDADAGRLETLARELGLTFQGVGSPPPGALHELRAPRIALYKGHTANMPEGWTRWLLDNYEFEYETIGNEDVRSGDLDDYDIVVLPDQEADEILNGNAPGTMPPEYVGGVGAEGAAALERYVKDGGWLLALDHAVNFAISQLGLPVRNAAAGTRPEEFFIPGTLIRIELDPADPLAWGMPERGIAFFVRSQTLEVVPPAAAGDQRAPRSVDVFAEYAEDDYLASGWANGAERYLTGHPAGVRLPVGGGQVVLLGFEPHFRGQPHNTYKLLFNPLFAAATDGLPGPEDVAADER